MSAATLQEVEFPAEKTSAAVALSDPLFDFFGEKQDFLSVRWWVLYAAKRGTSQRAETTSAMIAAIPVAFWTDAARIQATVPTGDVYAINSGFLSSEFSIPRLLEERHRHQGVLLAIPSQRTSGTIDADRVGLDTRPL
jgi:hypothetical protein